MRPPCLRVSVVCFTLALCSCAKPVQDPPPLQSGRWTVTARSVDGSDFPRIRLVLSIESSDGRGSAAFARDDCEVFEDHARQPVEKFASLHTEPVTVVFVFDRSGSMRGDKIAKARAAAIGFVRRMSDIDQAEVIGIDSVVDTVIDLTSDRVSLERALGGLEAGGRTAYYDGVRMAVEKCEKIKGARAIIAMTDGRDNESACTLDGAIAAARKAGVRVFSIGLGDDAEMGELERLSRGTGGHASFAPSADDLAALHVALSEQLHHEYLLEYESREAWDGRARRIQVVLGKGDTRAEAAFSFNPGGVIPVTPLPAGYVSERTRHAWLAERLQVFGALTLCLAFALLVPRVVSGAGHRLRLARFRSRCVVTLAAGSPLIGRLCANEQNREVAFREGETIVRCPSCDALHHLDCWTFNDARCYNSPPCRGRGPRLS